MGILPKPVQTMQITGEEEGQSEHRQSKQEKQGVEKRLSLNDWNLNE